MRPIACFACPRKKPALRPTDSATAARADVQDLLLFSNDPAEQFAIPMHQVARLERIRAMQIDSVGGNKVLQYRGGSLPLMALEEMISARPMPDTTWLYVVVFAAGRPRSRLADPRGDRHPH